MAKSNKYKVSDYKFRDIQKILAEYGYLPERRANSTHVKFVNKDKNDSVVVSGVSGKVHFPIVHKTFKRIGIL